MKRSYLLVPCLLLPLAGCLRIPVGRRQAPQTLITAAEYAQISPGMSYLQVEGIVGESGHFTAGNPASYSWYNANDGTGAIIFFEKDKVVQKGKIGQLK